MRADKNKTIPRVLVFEGRTGGNWTVAVFACTHRTTGEKDVRLFRWSRDLWPIKGKMATCFLGLIGKWAITGFEVFTDISVSAATRLIEAECVYQFLMSPEGIAWLREECGPTVPRATALRILGADYEELIAASEQPGPIG